MQQNSAKGLLRSSSSPAYFRDNSTCNLEASCSYLFFDNLIRNAKNPCLDLYVFSHRFPIRTNQIIA